MRSRLKILVVLAAATGTQSSGFTCGNAPADSFSLVQLSGPTPSGDRSLNWLSKLGSFLKRGKGSTEAVAASERASAEGDGSGVPAAQPRLASGPRPEIATPEEQPVSDRVQEQAESTGPETEEEERRGAEEEEEEGEGQKAEDERQHAEEQEEEERKKAEEERRTSEERDRATRAQQASLTEAMHREASEKAKLDLAKEARLAAQQLAKLNAEKETVRQDASLTADEQAALAEKRRLQELHDRLVAEMREKIMAEADAKVKQQMIARHAARQEELRQMKQDDKQRAGEREAVTRERRRVAEEEAQKQKVQRDRERAERAQSYKVKQQMKLEAEREALRKNKAAADRLAELQAKKAEMARRREEQARQEQLNPSLEVTEVPEEHEKAINLRLRDGLNREITVKVLKSGRLKPMMNVACQRFGIDRAHAAFSFGEQQIGFTDTPESVGLENGDVLTVIEVGDEVDSEQVHGAKATGV